MDHDRDDERVIDLSDDRTSGRRRWFGRKEEDDGSAATLVALRPAPRDVPSTSVALEMARDWMRYFAFTDAVVSSGPQPLVNSSRGLAHLMSNPRGVSTREVMEVHRLASMAGKYPLMFALGGFTAGAIRWADKNPTALFEFDPHGQVKPVSVIAKRLLEGSDRRHLEHMSREEL